MATEVASLTATLGLNNRAFTQGMTQAKNSLGDLRSSITGMGRQMQATGTVMSAAITAPLVGAGIAAGRMAVDFDRAMTNTRAVLGITREESQALERDILGMGARSVAGPQAVADAYYDIVGGVQDASTHMAILEAAIATSEAGQADLGATTSGLISVMNAYSMSAEDAGRLSDIFTTTVGMGVGSMDQFVSALGPASGLAYDVGIGFDELAASTAFLTSTGASASEATTQLTAVMTAFLKPNTKMQDALTGMGYESGQAALQALGLAGATQALYAEVGSTDAMAQALGSTEALGGAIGLNTDRANEFRDSFMDSIDGATEAARAIQLEGIGAQLGILKSSAEVLGITVGGVLLPPLVNFANWLTPIVQRLAETNPNIIKMAVGFLAVVAAAGPIIAAVGTIATVIGALMSPIGLAIAAAALLTVAYFTNFGGVKDFIDGTVAPALMTFFNFLRDTWTAIQPGLAMLYDWFVTSALPAVMTFVTDTALPGITNFVNFIVGAWALMAASLTMLYNWFMNTGLKPVIDFVTGPVTDGWNVLVTGFKNTWSILSGPLASLKDGIMNIIQPIIDRINDAKAALDELQRLGSNVGTGASAVVGIGEAVGSGQVTPGMLLNALQAEFGRADGGPVSAGQPYIVGERQAELFVPDSDGMIYPSLDSAPGGNISINMTVTEGSAKMAGMNFYEGLRAAREARG